MSKTLRGRRWTGWSSRRVSLLRPFPTLRLQELEARETPTTFTWTGGGKPVPSDKLDIPEWLRKK